MEHVVSISYQDDLALVRLNNPPVNATSKATRQGILDAVNECNKSTAKTVILYCEGRTFIAGGDMKEFDAPPAPPHLPDVVQAIEDSDIPWIAAMHGTVLGGGFEIAMGCAFRVALAKTHFGLPEVHVGIIPGAGGTQRLPRLIGLNAAIKMTTSGQMVSAEDLYKLEGLDFISNATTPLQAALDFCVYLPDRPTAISSRNCNAITGDAINQYQVEIIQSAKGQQSPLHCLDAVLWAANLPFSEGQKKERELHLMLRSQPESRALRHVFFAERAVAKPAALKNTKPRELHNIVVVGGGLMGAGIIFSCLMAGFHVTLIERDDASAQSGYDRITKLIDGGLKRAKITPESALQLKKQFTTGTDYNLAENADIAIEAVFEDLDIKRIVFQKLEKTMRSDAILATNTSYIDPSEIMTGIRHPERCIGLHFFSPAHIMKLLEIIRLPNTHPTVLATGFALAKRLRKIAVLSGVCDGFIGNRILSAYRRQADYLLMDGATPEQIDSAMREFGMPMGPYELQDLTGLQISWANRKRQAVTRPPNERYVAIGDRLCEAGRFGQRSGAGWYRYKKNETKPIPDPIVTDVIRSEIADAGIAKQQNFTSDAIIDRILAVIINEGACIVEEGIAERPLDIDMVMVNGYGFPRRRGGPMHYADEVGLENVKSNMACVAAQSPDSWVVSDMLK